MAMVYIFLLDYTVPFFKSTVDEHLYCFPFFAIKNEAINILNFFSMLNFARLLLK